MQKIGKGISVFSVLTLLTVMLFVGCDSSDSSTGAVSLTEIWPFSVGNEWVIAEYDEDSNMKEMRKYIVEPEISITYEGTEIMVFVLADYSKLNEEDDWDLDNDKGLYRYEDDDLYNYGWFDSDDNWYIDKELVIASSFANVVGAKQTFENGQAIVISIDETMTVPAGTFQCIQVHHEYFDEDGNIFWSFDRYWSVGIGEVALQVHPSDESQGGWTKLVSTNLSN